MVETGEIPGSRTRQRVAVCAAAFGPACTTLDHPAGMSGAERERLCRTVEIVTPATGEGGLESCSCTTGTTENVRRSGHILEP